MYIAEDQLKSDIQIIDAQSLSDFIIAINESIITRFPFPIYNKYNQNWHTDSEMSRHYWAASFFLPIGSIFILGMVVLLMVLFKRCPHTIAAIVATILTIIIVLATVISLNHEPIYT